MKEPSVSVLRTLLPSLLLALAPCALGSEPEETIDFAYPGGAFLMEKSSVEGDVISQFWQNVLIRSGMPADKVRVRNFVEEEPLYEVMKQGRVRVAGVTHRFFTQYEAALELTPLVVPMLGDDVSVRYCMLTRKDHPASTVEALRGQTIAVPPYANKWYYDRLLPDVNSEDYTLEKFPEQNSVLKAVLYKKAAAGVVSEYYLENYFELRPHFRAKTKIVMKTEPLLLPPLVCRAGTFSESDRQKLVATLLGAHEEPTLALLLELIGFSGFRNVDRESIRKAIR